MPIVAFNFPIIFAVTDGQTGNPVAGATVNGPTTDANGKVSVTFTQVGTQEVKATKPGAIRSNQITSTSFLDFRKKEKFVETIYLTTKEKLLISNFR